MEAEFYKILKDRSGENYNRYRECPLMRDIDTGEALLAGREIVEIPSNPADQFHRLQSQEVCRLDMLAHKYYRNPFLWWVIAQANDIYDPFEYIEPGTILRIPAMETLYGNNGILL